MISLNFYHNKTVAVFGLGRTGLSACRSLISGGARVLVWDDDADRVSAANRLDVEIVPPSVDGWKGIVALVISPGVPVTYPKPHKVVRLADNLGAEIISDIELFARTLPSAKVVAVTGTNGKSTTTSLIGHILASDGCSVQIGANLGKPVLDFYSSNDEEIFVLELSSYQIDLTNGLRPHIAILLNISPDHLERHGGMDGYISAKRKLLEMADEEATLIIGSDDPFSARICEEMQSAGCKVLEISSTHEVASGVFAKNGQLYRSRTFSQPVHITDLNSLENLRGGHNWQNCAAAFAAAETLGCRARQIVPYLQSYPGLPHRLEMVGQINKVFFINDSKATNAEAASHALGAYKQIYWIAGGIPKQGGIACLMPHLVNVIRAFFIGEAASEFASCIGSELPCELSGDLSAAVSAAYEAALNSGGGIILFSPACSSFDQFVNFEDRGCQFRALAEKIIKRGTSNGGHHKKSQYAIGGKV